MSAEAVRAERSLAKQVTSEYVKRRCTVPRTRSTPYTAAGETNIQSFESSLTSVDNWHEDA